MSHPQRCLIVIFVALLSVLWPGPAPMEAGQLPPGCTGFYPGRRGLAITSDGARAYLGFELEDAVMAVDLATFEVTARVDIAAAGIMLKSGTARLSPDGRKVWVANNGAGNVMVIDRATNRLEKVLKINPGWDCFKFSADGQRVFIPSNNNGGLYVVNTSDYTFTDISIPGFPLMAVAPSSSNPNLIYGMAPFFNVFGGPVGVFAYDLESHAVIKSAILSAEVEPNNTGVERFIIDPQEKTAYFGWMKVADNRGYGRLNAFDLENFQLLSSTAIENGITDFTLNIQNGKIYTIGFWSGGASPGSLPLTEWDTATRTISRTIMVAEASDLRSIAVDPLNANYVYLTDGDHNYLKKINLVTGEATNKIVFNQAPLSPMTIIPGGNIGYIVCLKSPRVFKVDLNTGKLAGDFSLPAGLPGMTSGGYWQGHLFFANNNTIYKVNPVNGSLVQAYNIAYNVCPFNFTFFGDKAVGLDRYPGGAMGRKLFYFDAATMQVIKTVDLPFEEHADKVVASPDGAKLYVMRGTGAGGTTTITIINGSTLETQATLSIPPVDIFTRGYSSFCDGYFEVSTRRLYLLGFGSVYVIHLDTDALLDILDTNQVNKMLGRPYGWSPTALSGISVNPAGNKLLVISQDSHCLYTYDLSLSGWLPEILNLRGYITTDAAPSADRKYLFAVNQFSDNLTMVNASTRAIKQIIELPTGNIIPFPTNSLPWTMLLLGD